MPADPSVYSQIQPVQTLQSPLEAMQTVESMRASQERRRAAQEQEKERQFIAGVWKQAQGDPDTAIELARKSGAGPYAMALEAQVGKMRKEAADGLKAQLDNEGTQLERGRSIVATIRDQGSLSRAKSLIRRMSPEIGEFLPDVYDPATTPALVEQLADVGLKSSDIVAKRKQAFDQLVGGPKAANEWRQAIGTALAAAPDQQTWEQTRTALRQVFGAPVEALAEFGEFSPESVARAEQASIGPEKRAELAGQQEGRQIQREGQQVTMRGQDIGAQTAAAGQRAQDARAAAARAVQIRGQNLTDARAKADGAGGAKLSAAAVEKIAGVDQSMGMLDDIEGLLPEMADNIGPMDGRVAAARLATGVTVTPKLATFAAQITGLKNAVIKATTGAAMSEPEAKRIMGQLPDLTQPEAVFKARLATTRKNLQVLKDRTIELSGGTVAAPVEKQPAAKDPLGIR